MSEEEKPVERRSIPAMNAEDMKEFILGVCDGRIFTDRHIHPNSGDWILGSIFMVIALGGGREFDPEDIGCVWEFLSEAGPRSINGYPMFFSCRFMNKKDAQFAFIQIQKEMKRRESLTLQMDLDLETAMKGREDAEGTPQSGPDQAVSDPQQEE